MQQSTKASLLELARKADAAKFIFCLNTIARETVDADFEEVLPEILRGVRSITATERAEHRESFEVVVRDVIGRVGAGPYVRAIGRLDDLAPDHVAFLLGPVKGPGQPSLEPSMLRDIAKTPHLDNDTIAWLAARAATQAELMPDLIRPLLERYGQDADSEVALADAGRQLLAQPGSVEALRGMLYETSGAHVPGALLLLGQAGYAEDISLVGAFIEDRGAWERVSRAVLTAERLESLAARIQQSDLSRVIQESRCADSRSRAVALAGNSEFHRSVARLISGSSVLAVASIFADSTVAATLKGFVADVDAPTRTAAARALSFYKHDAAIPFMRTGLVDRNKRVREICQAALEAQLGAERYETLLKQLTEESHSLRERLKKLTEWARGALTEIEGGLSSLASAVYARSVTLAAKTGDFLGWSRRDSHE